MKKIPHHVEHEITVTKTSEGYDVSCGGHTVTVPDRTYRGNAGGGHFSEVRSASQGAEVEYVFDGRTIGSISTEDYEDLFDVADIDSDDTEYAWQAAKECLHAVGSGDIDDLLKLCEPHVRHGDMPPLSLISPIQFVDGQAVGTALRERQVAILRPQDERKFQRRLELAARVFKSKLHG